jgi:excisionase family DNA binding protein
MKGKLLSPEDVAERLAVNPATVRSWLRSGKLKGVKLGKKIWRIDEREVRELLCREEDVAYGVSAAENCLEDVDIGDYRLKHKESILSNLELLSSGSLAKVDLLIRDLKVQESATGHDNKRPAYLRARWALSSIKGSLSSDIIEERKERL